MGKLLILGWWFQPLCNVDHNNPLHTFSKEGNDLLAVVEAANMWHLLNKVPTWISYGLYIKYVNV